MMVACPSAEFSETRRPIIDQGQVIKHFQTRMPSMMVTTPLFTSMPIPGGGSYTLTTYFGKMLSEAEELYGRRDMDWTPIGVEFFSGDVPHIWFPGNRKHVCIRLTFSAVNDLDEALWQLAHEIVHILGPVVAGKANNLEEGLATHFALNISHYADKPRAALLRQRVEQPASKYCSPLRDCEALLQIDPDIIKKLRRQQSYLSLAPYLGHENVLTTFSSYGDVARHRQADHSNAWDVRAACRIGEKGVYRLHSPNRRYGPVCPVVWEGRSRKAPPYPACKRRQRDGIDQPGA
jgi:hypothetical protein